METSRVDRQDRIIVYTYRIVIFMLTLTGMAQMPIFKRYYIADIPGLGWLAAFYVTHYLHYLFAIFLLALLGYLVTTHLLAGKTRRPVSTSGYVRVLIMAGLIVSGLLLVFRNFPGYLFSPKMIIVLNICHMGLVVALLVAGLICIIFRKKWMLEMR